MASGGDPGDPRLVVFNHHIKQRELRHGDHIYVHRKKYTYSHHGIWDDHNQVVIHFTQAANASDVLLDKIKSKLSSCSPCRDRSTGEVEGDKPTIVTTTLYDFLESEDDTSLKLFTYEDPFYLWKLKGTCSDMGTNQDPLRTVKVARWFAKYPAYWGDYDAGGWNCESFARFCKTTTRTVEQISLKPRQIGQDRKAWRSFLKEAGCTKSEQRPLSRISFLPRCMLKLSLSRFGRAMEVRTNDMDN